MKFVPHAYQSYCIDYIKTHPVFHLEPDEWEVIEADFAQFRKRIYADDVLFHEDKVGRLYQLLLMDMWSI